MENTGTSQRDDKNDDAILSISTPDGNFGFKLELLKV
jgi:hypothetical protein